MLVDISKLNKTKFGTDFSYNDRAENLVTLALCCQYDLIHRNQSEGYDPTYDQRVENTDIEVKMTRNKEFFVETSKADGTPSGISITESDVHMVVSPASIKYKNQWKQIMKVRLLHTSQLRHWVNHMSKNHLDEEITYKASSLGKGSKGFMLEWKKSGLDDLYVMGFEYTLINGNIVFDTQKIVLPENNYALKYIGDYIK